MKIIAIYASPTGENRKEIIDIPEVKTLYPSERQLNLCEDYVNLSKREGEKVIDWRLVDKNLHGLICMAYKK